LFDKPYREPRIVNPLRCWIGALYGKPRVHLLRELACWPAPIRERWKRQFEGRRYAPKAAATSPELSH
jgi:hypothetical protein